MPPGSPPSGALFPPDAGPSIAGDLPPLLGESWVQRSSVHQELGVGRGPAVRGPPRSPPAMGIRWCLPHSLSCPVWGCGDLWPWGKLPNTSLSCVPSPGAGGCPGEDGGPLPSQCRKWAEVDARREGPACLTWTQLFWPHRWPPSR